MRHEGLWHEILRGMQRRSHNWCGQGGDVMRREEPWYPGLSRHTTAMNGRSADYAGSSYLSLHPWRSPLRPSMAFRGIHSIPGDRRSGHPWPLAAYTPSLEIKKPRPLPVWSGLSPGLVVSVLDSSLIVLPCTLSSLCFYAVATVEVSQADCRMSVGKYGKTV